MQRNNVIASAVPMSLSNNATSNIQSNSLQSHDFQVTTQNSRRKNIRIIVILIIVFFLLDEGERSGHRQANHGKNNCLRKSSSVNARVDKVHWNRSNLNPKIFYARREEDRLVLEALRNYHPRWKELLKLNSDMDVEGVLANEIKQKLERDSESIHEIGDISEGDLTSEYKKGHAYSPSVSIAKRSNFADGSTSEDIVSDGIAVERKVSQEEISDFSGQNIFHYPRNATGYYSGHWSRIRVNSTVDDDERDELLNQLDITHESDGNNVIKNVDSEPSGIATVEEIYPWVQNRLSQKNDSVALMLLPHNISLGLESKTSSNVFATNRKSNAEIIHDPLIIPEDEDSNGHPPSSLSNSIPLSKNEGRAVLQLYSRSIPGMNELGIIHGYIKLYDGITDILFKVRGVIIYGIGRISLVTNWDDDGSNRSVLAVREGKKEEDTREKRKYNNVSDTAKHYPHDKKWNEDEDPKDEDHEDEDPKDEDHEDEDYEDEDYEDEDYEDEDREDEDYEDDLEYSRRHRRLRKNVQNLVSLSEMNSAISLNDGLGKDSKNADALKQIRDDAIDLYESKDSPYTPDDSGGYSHKSTETYDFTLLQSFEQTDFSRIDEAHFENTVIDGNTRRRLKEVDHVLLNDKTVVSRRDPLKYSFSGSNDDTKSATLHSRLTSVSEASAETEEVSSSQSYDTFQHIYPFPYVADDPEESLTKTLFPSKLLPSQEQSFKNTGNCEFEATIDVQAEKWTVSELLIPLEYRIRSVQALDPHRRTVESEGENGNDGGVNDKSHMYQSRNRIFWENKAPKEALVMSMFGRIESPNCQFNAFVNATAFRVNWGRTKEKVNDYSLYMMLTFLVQIFALLFQLHYSEDQSITSNVSLVCIGWQAIIDIIIFIYNLFLCVAMPEFVEEFTGGTFLKFMVGAIEVKYMALINQSRRKYFSSVHVQDSRKAVTFLWVKFFGALILATTAFDYVSKLHRGICGFILYSFWTPQIILNIVTQSKQHMRSCYIWGISLTRLVAPLYVFAFRENFLREVRQDLTTDILMCNLLIVWISIQTGFLLGQVKFGPQFMIPHRFLPPKFD